MQRRARWLLLAAVLVPGLVVGVLATTALAPQPTDPRGPLVETALWLGIAAVMAVALGLGLAALRLWLLGPIEEMARTVSDLPLGPTTDPLARIAAALAHFRRQAARDRVNLAGQLDAVDALRGEAEGARAQLHEADRMALLGRMAMGLSHELGGPLALLAGWLERLQALEAAGAPQPERQRCLAAIADAAAQIERLLTELARPGLQRQRDADRPCDMLAVARQLQAHAAEHPRLRQIAITVTASEPVHVADISASHLQQVLLNLVLNAADAMQRQGAVALRLTRDGRWQVLDVDDTGPGVPAALREAIFTPLFSTQAEAERPGQSGWGLGLAVSRRTVAGYGGSLTVASSPEGGARFSVRAVATATPAVGSGLACARENI